MGGVSGGFGRRRCRACRTAGKEHWSRRGEIPLALGRNQRWILSSDASSCSAACRGRVVRTVTSVVVGASGGEQRRRRWRWVFLTGGPTLQPPAVILDGKKTPWASAAERGREVRGGVNRHGRGKRRRRSEAGLETRDEESRIQAVTACPRHPLRVWRKGRHTRAMCLRTSRLETAVRSVADIRAGRTHS